MRSPGPSVAVPPLARARALGALIPMGTHAVAYANEDAEGVLAGFCLEGVEADERVLVLAGDASPRSVSARLRSSGVAAAPERPSGFRVLDASGPSRDLGTFLGEQAALAQREGFDGLRVAHLCGRANLQHTFRMEAKLPRRFDLPLTLLCVYGAPALARVPAAEAWALSRHHGRILLL